MMGIYLKTFCGRYGKRHNEQFLRRLTTGEPVDTPRRYYSSDESYKRGNLASKTAWSQWKQENFGSIHLSQTPWFELVDDELREINSLLSSNHHHDFDEGLQILESRVSRGNFASSMLRIDYTERAASRFQRGEWRDNLRKAPLVLVEIFTALKNDSESQWAKAWLMRLCDDGNASGTMAPSYEHEEVNDTYSSSNNQLSNNESPRVSQTMSGTSRIFALAQQNAQSPASQGSSLSRIALPAQVQKGEFNEEDVEQDGIEQRLPAYRKFVPTIPLQAT